MSLRKLTASLALAAVAFSVTAGSALAGPPEGRGRPARISQKFQDMSGFEWGLSHVVKMQVKGVFKGRGQDIFAPGAKITRQEAAVATVRLMDKEAEANALTEAEVTALLAGVSDHASIATWARHAVAYLIKVNATSATAAFGPQEDATRLYVAVLLVKALGFEAEAQSKMSASLSFKDAHLIPAGMVGYVAAAVDHKLITGYDDRTFKPEKAVKRVEMAVMMGRADGLFDRKQQDEIKGTVKSVNAASSTMTILTRGQEKSFGFAAESAIFVDGLEKELADLLPGMKVELKLNAEGLVIYLEAKTDDDDDDDVEVPAPVTATGSISAMTAPTASSTGSLVLTTGSATTTYTVASNVAVTLNGATSTFSALAVGDQASITVVAGLVSKIDVTRTTQVAGTVAALTSSTATSTASLTLTSGTTPTDTIYAVGSGTAVTINGQSAAFGDLAVGDNATLTLTGTSVTAINVVRATYSGLAVSVNISTTTQTISIGSIVNGVFSMVTLPVRSDARVTLNGQAATLASIQANDSVSATLVSGQVFTLAATR